MEHITAENYNDMRDRVHNTEKNDSVVGSTNFGIFMDYFESKDAGWIDVINKELEEC